MFNKISVRNFNRILSLLLVIIFIAILVLFIQTVVQSKKLKAELEQVHVVVIQEEEKNREINSMINNHDYYLQIESKKEYNFIDPEEELYIIS